MNGNRKPQWLPPVAAMLALAACTDGGGSGEDRTPTGDEAVVYQGEIIVLQQEEHESAGMCALVTTSNPPQCEGMPVIGWDWDSVPHEELMGTRWGSYILTGTYDGEAFTLTEEALSVDEVDMADYPHLQPSDPVFEEPSVDIGFEALEAEAAELSAAFPDLVDSAYAVEDEGVVAHTMLLTPELEAYAAEHFTNIMIVIQAEFVPLE